MAPELDRGPRRAQYVQIADHYRARIGNGELARGQRLPPLYTLAGQWGVSPRTIQKALTILDRENLVESSRGHGTYVAGGPPAPSTEVENQSAHPTGATTDENEGTVVVSTEVVECPASVAALFAIEADDCGMRWARRREEVIYRDGIPVQLSVSWMPPQESPARHG